MTNNKNSKSQYLLSIYCVLQYTQYRNSNIQMRKRDPQADKQSGGMLPLTVTK